jgi:photosystem II stability/assembly factor-like uncharacterized protein
MYNIVLILRYAGNSQAFCFHKSGGKNSGETSTDTQPTGILSTSPCRGDGSMQKFIQSTPGKRAVSNLSIRRKPMRLHLRIQLLVLLVGGCLTSQLSALPFQSWSPQNYQVGGNSFVSSRNGAIYLVFSGTLYRSVQDEGNVWQPIVNGVTAVAIDPQNEQVLYTLDTQNQINKTLDGGHKWITLNTGLPRLRAFCVYVHPTNSQEVFVGTESGLFKTSDAGFSWRATPFPGPVLQFLIDPRQPFKEYALVGKSMFMSPDAGTTWKPSVTGLPVDLVRGSGRTAFKVAAKISLLMLISEQKPFLLAATEGKGVFRSDDDGASWKPSGAGIAESELFTKGTVNQGQVILASTTALYSSPDGSNWKRLPILSGMVGTGPFLGVIGHPRHTGLLLSFHISADIQRLAYLDSHGVLIGLSYGVVPWSDITSLWIGVLQGRSVIYATAVNVDSKGYIQTGISASLDGGYSWPFAIGTVCGDHGFTRKGSASEMWIYGYTNCVLKTEDGGASWARMPGFDSRYSNAETSKIEPDPSDRNLLYYSVGVNERYIYRYQYDPSTKQGHAVDLKVVASDILVAEDNNKMLFAGNGQLSADGGWTWTDKHEALRDFLGDLVSFKLISFKGQQLRAAVGRFNPLNTTSDIRIIQSKNLGSSWEEMKAFQSRLQSLKLFVNTNNSSNFFLVTSTMEEMSERSVKVLETKNGGEDWNEIYSHAVEKDDWQREPEIVNAVAQIPTSSGRTLLIGGRHGLWKSDDEGKTWKRLGGIQ